MVLKSFVNEHSAELILVPTLIEALRHYGYQITPVFYWASREGGVVSRSSFGDVPIKLLVMYARRPKVEFIGASDIYFKLNQLLFDRSSHFHEIGIPVIAGLPVANKLEDMCLGMKCIWTSIEPAGAETILKINLEDLSVPNFSNIFLPIQQIVDKIEKTHIFYWNDLLLEIDIVRKLPISSRSHSLFLYGDLYKPIYLIISKLNH